MSSSSSSFLDTHRSRPAPNMPSRLLSSLKRPFSKPKHDPYPSNLPDRTREPGPGATPPSYGQIVMGLHLSRTPHIPAHLAHVYPPTLQPRLQRSVSSLPTSSAPQRAHRAYPISAHLPSTQSRSHSSTASRSPSRSYAPLPPPPARSALKKPRTKATATSSSLTPDSASASTVASSVAPSTPTSGSARSRLLSRFLGKERGAAPALVSTLAETESEPGPERKAVRFGGLEEEDES